MRIKWPVLSMLVFVFYALSCGAHQHADGLHFSLLPATETGIDFNNTITENDSLNMFVNEYSYMGGGVGVGDFNNDGLPDIFFAGNQVSSQLYLNKGRLQFENITQKAGVATSAWCTGVSVIDINNDGWADIYVSVSGRVPGGKRANKLFINQHNLTFTEEAAAYGLADTSFSTQAAFLDYDRDGRPDMYLLNHNLDDNRPNDIRDRKVDSNNIAADKLYHNEGVLPGTNHPFFKEVSHQANILEDGNGLGVVVSDYNGDGYPDIYVANDYIKNDLLWLNNKNGTFSNCIQSAIRHQSYSSMGTEAADLNNDGLPDIITLDMQPETNERKKMMYSFLNDQRHQLEMDKGYEPEYIRNMLQLNNGVRMVNQRAEPFFSEIGAMAGIAETDWSWSVLAADFDNDGWKDVHITNGMGRDPTNIDFLEYRRNTVLQTGIRENNTEQQRTLINHLAELGPVPLHNYLYRNKGGVEFEDISMQGGIDQPSISNGAVYADLDNDGDLDIITSNINSNAFVLRNDTRQAARDNLPRHYLTVTLHGDTLNRDATGAIIYAYNKDNKQLLEQYPVRGYLSTVDKRLHVGFTGNGLDSLQVIWPDQKTQTIRHPPSDTILELNYAAAAQPANGNVPVQSVRFHDITTQTGISFQHKESFFYDYAFQPLLPQKFSQEGPFISTGDVNGDGRIDFFIGGAFKQPGKIFLQQANGTFTGNDLVAGTKNEEDMQSVLFDADGDKDLDLLVVSGSSEFDVNSSFYRPRLYLNDGKGHFTQDSTAFSPLVRTPGKCIAINDMDGDGDMDVFIGGRVSIGTYPLPPRSYLLRNDHGKFTDVTAAVCPALENPGLLNAAVWADIDNDKKPELIIAGDWMPIRIFKNDGHQLVEMTDLTGMSSLGGMWRSLAVADIDHDGDLDIVAGNIGLNNLFHITAQRPAELVAKDFDGNGVIEPVFCYYIKDNKGEYQLSAGISRDEWATQMPSIKKVFDHNDLYARAPMDQLFTKEMMDKALVLHCSEPRSGWFENKGKTGFIFHAFPAMAQVAPVNAIVCTDIRQHAWMDILLAGNEYQAQVMTGRYDASYGLWLTGDGHGKFTSEMPGAGGLLLNGDVKDMKLLTAGRKRMLLVGVNDAPMEIFSIEEVR